MSRKILPRVIAGTAVLALAAACGGGGGGEEEAAASSFSLQGCEPEEFIPGHSNELCGGQILKYLFTGLVDFDKDSKPVNAMAESIESPDQTVWTIKIKSGWKFHNGEDVTAQSFVDSWNYTAYGPNAMNNSYFMEKIAGYTDLNPESGKPKTDKMSGLEAVDDTTLKVTLTAPFSQFPLVIGYSAFTPLPKVAFEDMKKFEEAPIGNGPYRMSGKWKHDREIKIKRYADYKGTDKGHVENINYKIYANLETAYNDLLAGNLDQTPIPPTRLSGAKAELGDKYFSAPTSQFTRLDFPMYDKRFKNKDLRHAISMAINRQEIIDKIFNGAHTPAKSLITPVVGGQRPDACKEYCDYNPAEAKKLYQKSGGFKGTLNLWFNSDGGHEEWMQAVANQLRTNLGIKDIKLRQLPQAQYLPAQRSKKMDGPMRNGWVMDYPSLQNYLEPLYATGGSANRTFYSNKQVDKFIDQGNQKATIEEGYPDYYKAEDQVLEDMPIIPLWFHNTQQARSDHIKNVTVDPFSIVRLSEIQIAD